MTSLCSSLCTCYRLVPTDEENVEGYKLIKKEKDEQQDKYELVETQHSGSGAPSGGKAAEKKDGGESSVEEEHVIFNDVVVVIEEIVVDESDDAPDVHTKQ